jgi:hypothetical protein
LVARLFSPFTLKTHTPHNSSFSRSILIFSFTLNKQSSLSRLASQVLSSLFIFLFDFGFFSVNVLVLVVGVMRKVICGWLIIWVCLGLGLFVVSGARLAVWVRGWGSFGCARSSISAKMVVMTDQ